MVNEQTPEPEEIEEEEEELPTLREIVDDTADKVADNASRIRDSGWRPLFDLFGTYAERIVDGVQGAADGFSGKKKKD